LTPNFPGLENALRQVCADLGYTIKLTTTQPGERITYLGRVFPQPLTHDDSHQEAIRTLAKLHLSANKAVSRNQAAYNKATGYLSSDALTPVISDWAMRVVELSGITSARGLLGEEMWKMDNGAWPQHDVGLIAQSFAADLGLSSAELAEYAAKVRVAVDFDSFPAHYDNGPRQVVIPAIVGDVLLTPEPVVQCLNPSSPHMMKPPGKPSIHQRGPAQPIVKKQIGAGSPAKNATSRKSSSQIVAVTNISATPPPTLTSSPVSPLKPESDTSPMSPTMKQPANLSNPCVASSSTPLTKRQRKRMAQMRKRREKSGLSSSKASITAEPVPEILKQRDSATDSTHASNPNNPIVVLAEVH